MGDVPNVVDVGVFVAIVAAVVVVVGVSAQSLGFVRDEGYYFKAATLYGEWFRMLGSSPLKAMSAASIDAHLSYNPEHPFLMKGLFAFSALINDVTGIAAPHNAMRFPAWCVAGLCTALTYALARTLHLSRALSLAAALFFISMPRVFWHMHLATFDVAVTAAHVGLITAYLRFRHSRAGAIVIGVAFGVAAATKHNVLPIPALLVFHWLLTSPSSAPPSSSSLSSSPSSAPSSAPAPSASSNWLPAAFPALAVVAPLVYVALWPYLWPNPVGRFGAYIGFHMRHEHYPIMLFGELLTAPPFPWSFPVVMWALTIPTPLLVLGGGGVALASWSTGKYLMARLRRRSPLEYREYTRVPLGDVRRGPSSDNALLLLLNAAAPVFLIALPNSPIFGGTKHWMNALPFVVVLGVWAMGEAVARLRLADGVARVALVVVVALPGVLHSAAIWPYGLSYYNAVAGFARGAANLGLQRTFWGYEIRETLPTLNGAAPPNARVHGGDVNADSFARGLADGLIRADLRYTPSVRGADVAHVEPQGEFKMQQLDVWNEWARRDPDVIVDVDGVPLSTLTFRRRPKR